MMNGITIGCDIRLVQLIRIRIVYSLMILIGLHMIMGVVKVSESPSKPAASYKALAPSANLQNSVKGDTDYPVKQQRRWGTIGFMIVIHALTIFSLLPRFWSFQAITAFLILYWVTACLGVTLGYHRLLSHRSFRVPKWLERFFATCGALSCQHGPIDWVGLHRHHHKFSNDFNSFGW